MVPSSFVDCGQKLRVLSRKPKKGLPSGQTGTYWKTKFIQFNTSGYGDPIKSGPSDPKKWGLHRRSINKMQIFGPKMGPGGRNAVQRVNTKILSFWCPVMMVSNILKNVQRKWILGPKNCIRQPRGPNWPTVPPHHHH